MKKLLLGVVLAIAIVGCEESRLSGPIKYEVLSVSSDFSVFYENESGGNTSKDIKGYTWEVEFEGGIGDFVYISAISKKKNAEITANIYYRDKLIETATSEGNYANAIASGSVE